MKNLDRRGALLVLLVALAAWPVWAQNARIRAPQPMPASRPANPAADRAGGATPLGNPQQDARKSQLHDLDEQIKSLRDQLKSQVDPLEAQIKALRDKFDPQIKSLQEQRKELAQQGESPELKSLDDDQASQLAALDDKEKEEIAQVRQRYDEQKKQLIASYQQKRKDLLAKK